MVLCFSGTGNSSYIASRIAKALQEEMVNLNAKIKVRDCSPIQTGRNIIIVTPTYAWLFRGLYQSGFPKRNCFLRNAFGL